MLELTDLWYCSWHTVNLLPCLLIFYLLIHAELFDGGSLNFRLGVLGQEEGANVVAIITNINSNTVMY